MSVFNRRIQPLRDLMKSNGLDAFVLRRNPNLAWAIGGRLPGANRVNPENLNLADELSITDQVFAQLGF